MLYFNLLKYFFINHITSIKSFTNLYIQISLLFTSKSLKTNNTNFTFKSLQIHPFILP